MPQRPRTASALAGQFLLFSLLLCLIFVAASSAGTKKPPLKPINLHTAGSEELQQVPGIGPATAEKILQIAQILWPLQKR